MSARSGHARRWIGLAGTVLLALAIAGCGTSGGGKKRGGGYYKDDGPGNDIPSDIDKIPDAVPRIEPFASGANKPYVVFGKRYVPDTSNSAYKRRGLASWYGKKFHGNSTSIGESYNMYSMTAAHTTLPLPSYARVTSMINGKSVIVRVNDRGPFHDDRIMDLSYAAAHRLGIVGPGSGEVVVERLMPDEIRMMAAGGTGATASAAPPVMAGAPAATPIYTGGQTMTSDLDLPSSAPAPLPADLTPGPATASFEGDRMASAPAPLPPPAPAYTPPPAAVASASSASGSGVFLQLGAFSQPANAQTLVSRVNGEMAGQTPPAMLEPSGDSLYRVKLGPFTSREAALSAAQTVHARTGIMPSLALP